MSQEHPIRAKLSELETNIKIRHSKQALLAEELGMNSYQGGRAQGQADCLDMLRGTIELLDSLGLFDPPEQDDDPYANCECDFCRPDLYEESN